MNSEEFKKITQDWWDKFVTDMASVQPIDLPEDVLAKLFGVETKAEKFDRTMKEIDKLEE